MILNPNAALTQPLMARRPPVTNGPEWKQAQAFPKGLPAAATLFPIDEANENMPDRWVPGYGMSLGRVGRRGLTGTDELALGVNRHPMRPGATMVEGPMIAGTDFLAALSAARVVARAADKADPAGKVSALHTVGVFQGLNGVFMLAPTVVALDRGETGPLPGMLDLGSTRDRNPVVVKPTNGHLQALVSARNWIDLRWKRDGV